MKNAEYSLAPTQRCRVMREHPDYHDLLRIVAGQYEIYDRIQKFMSPWNARQIGNGLPYRTAESGVLQEAIGKTMSCIPDVTKFNMIRAAIEYGTKNRGMKQLPVADPVTLHSAQLIPSQFTITQVNDKIKFQKHPPKNQFRVEIAGAERHFYVDNMNVKPAMIQMMILRPQIGRLGTPDISRWEILLYTNVAGGKYLIDHQDSNLNPRWSGIL